MTRAIHLFYTIAIVSILILTHQPAQAGFEWVPAKKDTPAAAPMAEKPMMAPSQPLQPKQSVRTLPTTVPAKSEDDIMMVPMPLEEGVDTQSPEPVMAAPAPTSPPPTMQYSGREPITDISEPMQPKPAQSSMGMKTIDMSAPKAEQPMTETTASTKQPLPVDDLINKQDPAPQEDITWAPTAESEVAEEPMASTETHIIMPDDAPQNAMDTMPGSQRLNINPFPAASEPAEMTMDAPAPIQNLSQADPDAEPVLGFGTDVPLAIALGQVIPPSFALSFGENVNPGAKVSWAGGKGWEEIVTDMVAPLGLQPVIRGNTVHVMQGTIAPRPMQHGATMNTPQPLSVSMSDDANIMAENKKDAEPIIHISEDNMAKTMDIEMSESLSEPEPLQPAPAQQTTMVEIMDQDITEGPFMPLPGGANRNNITDPGLQAADQKPEAVNHLQEITANTAGKSAEEMNAQVLEANKKMGNSALGGQPKQLEASMSSSMIKTTPKDGLAPPPPSAAAPKPLIKNVKTEIKEAETVTPSPAPVTTVATKAPTGEPPVAATKVRFWEAKEGSSLKETLADWSEKADTALVWNASHDYIIKSNLLVNDTFQNAVRKMFSKVLEDPSGPSLELISEAGTGKPSKLIIEDLG